MPRPGALLGARRRRRPAAPRRPRCSNSSTPHATPLGLFLIVLFTISLVHELMTGTVFGLGICIMLIVLGALLTRDGLCQLTGLRLQFKKVE